METRREALGGGIDATVSTVHTFGTDALAREGLSPKCLNVLLLGCAVGMGALPFGPEELRGALRQLMKPRLVDMNERALDLGISLA